MTPRSVSYEANRGIGALMVLKYLNSLHDRGVTAAAAHPTADCVDKSAK